MKKNVTKAFLYVLAILHLPWTLIRVAVCFVLIVDLWCDRTIENWLKEFEELKNNQP